MMISLLLVGGGLALPLVVVPIRKSMGLDTYQWEGTAKANPVSLSFSPRWHSSFDKVAESCRRRSYSCVAWGFSHASTPNEPTFLRGPALPCVM